MCVSRKLLTEISTIIICIHSIVLLKISNVSLLRYWVYAYFNLLSVLEIGPKMMTSSKRKTRHGLLLCCGRCFNIGITHVFPSINICRVPRKLSEHEAAGWVFKHLPRDPANSNALNKHVWSLFSHFIWFYENSRRRRLKNHEKAFWLHYTHPLTPFCFSLLLTSLCEKCYNVDANKNQDKMFIPGQPCIVVWRHVNNLCPVLRIFK